jgi:hypothetical protein
LPLTRPGHHDIDATTKRAVFLTAEVNVLATGDDSLSLPAIAKLLKIGYGRVYHLVLTGELAGEKHDGRWIVERSTFEDFVERRGLRIDEPG